MSLDIVRGKAKNLVAIKELIDALIEHKVNGTFYVGYPILASADKSVTLDALLVAEGIGLIVFHIPNVREIDLTLVEQLERLRDIQDSLFYALENNLGRHEDLRIRRSLAVKVNIVSYIPNSKNIDIDRDEIIVAEKENLKTILDIVFQFRLFMAYFLLLCYIPFRFQNFRRTI